MSPGGSAEHEGRKPMTDEQRTPAPRLPDAYAGVLDDVDPGLGLERPTSAAQPIHRHRQTFDRELQEVKDSVLRMGSLVEESIRQAIDALVRHDADLASAVIVGDAGINEVQRKVSSMITASIATQAPVARDLRFLLTLDHVSYELERMGDHASSVAKQVRKLASEPPLKGYVDLPKMGELAAQIVHGILRALVDIDQEMAREVAASRALVHEAARAKDRGEPIGELSSLAKWTASDAAMKVATDAVQLFGGTGYSRETGIERLMRDAKGAQIYEGTNQIHRLIVADAVLGRATNQS